MKGTRVLIRDEKKGITIAEITHTSTFDKDTYEKTLRKAAGTFSKESHPEWNTEGSIIKWVTKNRLSDERSI